jgi:hypothetical protein
MMGEKEFHMNYSVSTKEFNARLISCGDVFRHCSWVFPGNLVANHAAIGQDNWRLPKKTLETQDGLFPISSAILYCFCFIIGTISKFIGDCKEKIDIKAIKLEVCI